MSDVDEIIYYLKTLKKGFDKDLYQNKLDELTYAVESSGLEYDDFHTLFKVWLNLAVPISKWVSLGSCLVPPDMVEERTVEYSFRWILANLHNQSSFPRLGFLLDWLTAAMESESIDMNALDSGYEIFYNMLTYEVLTVHAMKLVYTLTKPVDVTRRRVLELIHYAKNREAKKTMYRQLQVLLGLFKSYKPECVPEDVPAISIHTAFKKLNVTLLTRFRRNQEKRNTQSKEIHHLMWVNPVNMILGARNKADPLVPNLAYNNTQSRQDSNREMTKSLLDFSDPVSLVHHQLHHSVSRPARLRALLCNEAGLTLLAITPHSQQEFVSHDLYHLLNNCFLEVSRYTYIEKQDLLKRLAVLQRTVTQGIPVITRFLAQYLPFWNEKDYFGEILELSEWVSVYCPEHVQMIVDSLSKVYHRSQPIEQCAILRSLTNMYTNLVYASTKKRQHFLNTLPSPSSYTLVVPDLAVKITNISNKHLQVNPDDFRALYPAVWSSYRRSWSDMRAGGGLWALPAPLTLALPLISVSAGLIDSMAELMILYRKILSTNKDEEKIQILSRYVSDMLNCLYSEDVMTERENGLIFSKLTPQVVSKLCSIVPNVDSLYSIRNHIAFAADTYLQLEGIDCSDVDNKMWFQSVIDPEFDDLSRFLKKAITEFR